MKFDLTKIKTHTYFHNIQILTLVEILKSTFIS